MFAIETALRRKLFDQGTGGSQTRLGAVQMTVHQLEPEHRQGFVVTGIFSPCDSLSARMRSLARSARHRMGCRISSRRPAPNAPGASNLCLGRCRFRRLVPDSIMLPSFPDSSGAELPQNLAKHSQQQRRVAVGEVSAAQKAADFAFQRISHNAVGVSAFAQNLQQHNGELLGVGTG